MTATLKDFCGWSPSFLFALGFSVWKDSNIGTIFYRNQGKKELSVAKQECDDANRILTTTAGIKDKNIVRIAIPDPRNDQENQFYQNLYFKYSDRADGFWIRHDELKFLMYGGPNMKQAFCTFICRKRGINFYIVHMILS